MESGSAPGLRQIFDEHGQYVWRALRYLGVRDADLEDVCQEVFLVVHRKISDFEGRSSLRTWLYGICVRTASDYRKRAYNRREMPSDPSSPTGALAGPPHTAVEEATDRAEARDMLRYLLDRLSDDKRTVLVLYELEGLTMTEVSEVVGCPLQTAYWRLHAGREEVARAAKRLQARGAA